MYKITYSDRFKKSYKKLSKTEQQQLKKEVYKRQTLYLLIVKALFLKLSVIFCRPYPAHDSPRNAHLPDFFRRVTK